MGIAPFWNFLPKKINMKCAKVKGAVGAMWGLMPWNVDRKKERKKKKKRGWHPLSPAIFLDEMVYNGLYTKGFPLQNQYIMLTKTMKNETVYKKTPNLIHNILWAFM